MSRAEFVNRYKVTDGRKFRLSDYDPKDDGGLDIDKGEARERLKDDIESLSELQEKLYAQNRWSVLLIFQAMDAAGKDSAIEHVMSGINPQGCQVHSFKTPTAIELDHDWMWRTNCALPERGRIGVFNRSYYEEVLIVRVHPEILGKQQLPHELVTKNIWEERFEDIRNFERYLARNGTLILKFFLNLSKQEQKKRFLDRIDEPEKNWKFNAGDVAERMLWDKYMNAYEETIRNTADEHAPWYVVPADKKWYTRLVVAAAIDEAMQSLNLQFPKVDGAGLEELKKSRELLMKEK